MELVSFFSFLQSSYSYQRKNPHSLSLSGHSKHSFEKSQGPFPAASDDEVNMFRMPKFCQKCHCESIFVYVLCNRAQNLFCVFSLRSLNKRVYLNFWQFSITFIWNI